MKAIILAAGDGGRLGAGIPKILLDVGGKTILDYHIKGLKFLGIEEIIIIVGYKKELVEKYIQNKNLRNILKITLVENNHYDDLENGYSVYCAKEYVDSEFLLIMGDHLIDYSVLSELIKKNPVGFMEVVDSYPKYTNIKQATKVLIKDGAIKESGKNLTHFNALDTGFFIVSPEAFKILKKNKDNGYTEWNECVKYFINKGIKIFDVNGVFWMGVNTPEEFKDLKKKVIYLN